MPFYFAGYLSRNFSGDMLHYSFPVSWSAAFILTLAYFLRNKRKWESAAERFGGTERVTQPEQDLDPGRAA